jgi:hypothetical protein
MGFKVFFPPIVGQCDYKILIVLRMDWPAKSLVNSDIGKLGNGGIWQAGR